MLADARRLAGAATQVVELRTAHIAAAHHLDGIDARAVQREDALDTLAVRQLAHGEGGVEAAVAARDADALESMDELARAFDHLHVHAHGSARSEQRRGGKRVVSACKARWRPD